VGQGEWLRVDGRSKPIAYRGGPFDLILMNFAVCYASTFEELRAWTDNAFINLAPGGRLVLSNTRMALPEPECSELASKFGIQYSSMVLPPSHLAQHSVSWSSERGVC